MEKKKNTLLFRNGKNCLVQYHNRFPSGFLILAHNLLEVYIISARPHYYHFLPCTSFFLSFTVFQES